MAVALVGATASGKSALAHAARARESTADVEILCVDSMTVYRGHGPRHRQADARRSAARSSYHLLDLVEPSEEFTVAQFQREAREAARRRVGARADRSSTSAAPDSTVARCSTISRSPGSIPEVRAELESARRRRDSRALRRTRARSTRVAASRMEPTNARRIVRALEVTLGARSSILLLRRRACATTVRCASCRWDFSVNLRSGRANPSDVSTLGWRRDYSRRSHARERARRTESHGPPGRGIPRTPSPRRRRRRPRAMRRGRHHPESATGASPAFVVPARSARRVVRRPGGRGAATRAKF